MGGICCASGDVYHTRSPEHSVGVDAATRNNNISALGEGNIGPEDPDVAWNKGATTCRGIGKGGEERGIEVIRSDVWSDDIEVLDSTGGCTDAWANNDEAGL